MVHVSGQHDEGLCRKDGDGDVVVALRRMLLEGTCLRLTLDLANT